MHREEAFLEGEIQGMKNNGESKHTGSYLAAESQGYLGLFSST